MLFFLCTHHEQRKRKVILFTGDLNSTSLKMEKANKLGIKIREY